MGKKKNRRGGGQNFIIAEETRIHILRTLEQFQASKDQGKPVFNEALCQMRTGFFWVFFFTAVCLVAGKFFYLFLFFSFLKTNYYGLVS